MNNVEENKKKGKPAKEVVNLTHVETHKQKIDRESLADLFSLQKEKEMKGIKEQIQEIDVEDKNILMAFQKKRLLLDRIWIIVNQTRTQLNLEPIKRADLKIKLDHIVELGYLTHEEIEDSMTQKMNDVYVLTDKGQDEIV